MQWHFTSTTLWKKKKLGPRFNLQNPIHWLKTPHPSMSWRCVTWKFKGTMGSLERSCCSNSCIWARDDSSSTSLLVITNTPAHLPKGFLQLHYIKCQPSKNWNFYWSKLDISCLSNSQLKFPNPPVRMKPTHWQPGDNSEEPTTTNSGFTCS